MLARFIGADNTTRQRLLVLMASLVTIWLVFQISTGGLFFTPRNFYNLAVQSSVVAVLTVGMVIVIASKNIDLSVGSLLGLVGMVVAVLQIRILPPDVWWNTPVTIVVALVLGALLGIWQGFLIAYIKIPSFVVTLAGLLIFRGISTEVARGETVSPFLDSYRIFGGGAKGSIGETWSWIVAAILIAAIAFTLARTLAAKSENKRFRIISMLAAASFVLFIISMFNAYDIPRSDFGHGIPSTILILLSVGIIASFVVARTPIGKHIFAVGQDIEAARLVGVPTRLVVLKVFAAMGVLCAIGAVISTARLNAGTANLGTLLELNVIAAAVIGGASLNGGRGSVLGGIIGAFVIQSLDTGLVLMSVTSSQRQILIGFVLLAAVWFDSVATKSR